MESSTYRPKKWLSIANQSVMRITARCILQYTYTEVSLMPLNEPSTSKCCLLVSHKQPQYCMDAFTIWTLRTPETTFWDVKSCFVFPYAQVRSFQIWIKTVFNLWFLCPVYLQADSVPFQMFSNVRLHRNQICQFPFYELQFVMKVHLCFLTQTRISFFPFCRYERLVVTEHLLSKT